MKTSGGFLYKLMLTAGMFLCAVSMLAATPLTIVRATYGADSRQIDVTASVIREIQAHGIVRADTSLAGKDPAFGTVKTLTIEYVENGQQLVATAKEGETLSLSRAVAQAPTQAAIARPPEPRLAPPGIFYLLNRKSIKSDSGIVGINVGTPVRLLSEQRDTARVSTEEMEFDIDKAQLTNDWSRVAPLVSADQSAQASLRDWQEASRQTASLQRKANSEALAQTGESQSAKPAFGSYSNSAQNPLNRGAYNRSLPPPIHAPSGDFDFTDSRKSRNSGADSSLGSEVADEYHASEAKRLQRNALEAETRSLERASERGRATEDQLAELRAKRALLSTLRQ